MQSTQHLSNFEIIANNSFATINKWQKLVEGLSTSKQFFAHNLKVYNIILIENNITKTDFCFNHDIFTTESRYIKDFAKFNNCLEMVKRCVFLLDSTLSHESENIQETTIKKSSLEQTLDIIRTQLSYNQEDVKSLPLIKHFIDLHTSIIKLLLESRKVLLHLHYENSLQKQNIDINTMSSLGEGAQATVYSVLTHSSEMANKNNNTNHSKATIETSNQVKYAIKFFAQHKHYAREHDFFKMINKAGNHPNVLKEINKYEKLPAICLEFCENGDLAALLHSKSNQKFINYTMLFEMAIQICEAIEFLHNLNIIHCDIKPSNIFLAKANQPKLADFGLAILEDEEAHHLTPLYIDPVMIWNKNIHNSKTTDIYAYGVVFLEMFSRLEPCSTIRKNFEEEVVKLFQHLHKTGRPADELAKLPEECQKLVKECCARNSSNRPNANEILPILQNLKDKIFINEKLTFWNAKYPNPLPVANDQILINNDIQQTPANF